MEKGHKEDRAVGGGCPELDPTQGRSPRARGLRAGAEHGAAFAPQGFLVTDLHGRRGVIGTPPTLRELSPPPYTEDEEEPAPNCVTEPQQQQHEAH